MKPVPAVPARAFYFVCCCLSSRAFPVTLGFLTLSTFRYHSCLAAHSWPAPCIFTSAARRVLRAGCFLPLLRIFHCCSLRWSRLRYERLIHLSSADGAT